MHGNHTLPHASCQDCCDQRPQRRQSVGTGRQRQGLCEQAPQTDVVSVGIDILEEVFHVTFDTATSMNSSISTSLTQLQLYSSTAACQQLALD